MFFLSVDFKVVSGWVGQNKFSCQCAVVSRLELGWTLLQKPNMPCPALLSPRQSPRRHIMYTCTPQVRYAHSLDSSLETGKSGKIPKYIYTEGTVQYIEERERVPYERYQEKNKIK